MNLRDLVRPFAKQNDATSFYQNVEIEVERPVVYVVKV